MEILLVRHGQSEANAGLTDFLDSPLTLLGQEQARLTAERLRGEGVTRAYVSPLRRTLQTIQPICEAIDRPAEVYADVCEYFSAHYPGYRTFPGLTPAQIQQQFPFTFFGDTFPCSDIWWPQEAEDDARMYDRAVRVRDALLELYAGTTERLLIVSHAETVGRLTEEFLRIPLTPEEPPWSDNCGITQLCIKDDPEAPATAQSLNDTSHLSSLLSHATG
jgi:broad specificity phosphatase PhoE